MIAPQFNNTQSPSPLLIVYNKSSGKDMDSDTGKNTVHGVVTPHISVVIDKLRTNWTVSGEAVGAILEFYEECAAGHELNSRACHQKKTGFPLIKIELNGKSNLLTVLIIPAQEAGSLRLNLCYNPAKLDNTSAKRLLEFFERIMPDTNDQGLIHYYENATVSKIDFAIDVSVPMQRYLPMLKYAKLKKIYNTTNYLGSKSSSLQLCVYDKKAEQLSVHCKVCEHAALSRFEFRWRKSLKLSDLPAFDFSLIHSKMILADIHKLEANPCSLSPHIIYLAAIQNYTQLALLTPYERRKLRCALEKNQADWWADKASVEKIFKHTLSNTAVHQHYKKALQYKKNLQANEKKYAAI